MRKIILATTLTLGMAGIAGLAACSTSSTIIPTAQQVLADIQGSLTVLEGNGTIPANLALEVQTGINGLSSIVSVISGSTAAGNSTVVTALKSSVTAIQTLMGDLKTNATITTAGNAAVAALETAEVNTAATAQTQAEAALATFLIDYMAATPAPAKAQLMLNDAKANVSKM